MLEIEIKLKLLCNLLNASRPTVANGIFVQRDYSIRREYQAVVEDIYRGEIKNLNFRDDPQGSAKIINEWVFASWKKEFMKTRDCAKVNWMC